MDWVHCNTCYYQPGQKPKRQFFLTNCGHIFCKSCERSGNILCCKVCGACCTSTPLSSNMSPEVEEYFKESECFLEKTIKVVQFQNSHRLKLLEHYRRGMDKYQNLKSAFIKQQEALKKSQEEVKNLKRELEFYKRRPDPFTVSPRYSESSSPRLFNLGKHNHRIVPVPKHIPVEQHNSPLFTTPHPPKYAPQEYRSSQYPSPLTPISEGSASPASSQSSSNRSYRSAPSNSSLRSYNDHIPESSPPFDQLSRLCVKPGNASQHL